MIVGYNGSEFFGSQKNKQVRTVEEQVEKALFNLNLISEHNYGDIKKIGWQRASRTDKSVHALQNVFSCKIHLAMKDRSDLSGGSDTGFEKLRAKLNQELRSVLKSEEGTSYQEVKVFCIIEVSNRFNAKLNASFREYSYYLPTFTLAKCHSEFFLGRGKTQQSQQETQNERVVNGVTIVTRDVGEED
jgi:tRNA pseudouridine38-40 synthase